MGFLAFGRNFPLPNEYNVLGNFGVRRRNSTDRQHLCSEMCSRLNIVVIGQCWVSWINNVMVRVNPARGTKSSQTVWSCILSRIVTTLLDTWSWYFSIVIDFCEIPYSYCLTVTGFLSSLVSIIRDIFLSWRWYFGWGCWFGMAPLMFAYS